MKIGIHVSIAESIDRAVDNAVAIGCTAFKMFTRNPRGWHAKPLSGKDVSKFKEKLAASKIDRYATSVDMPFLPNLASPDDNAYARSVKVLIDEIKRCSKIGIPYLMTHLGNHKGAGDKAGMERVVKALTKAAESTTEDVMILIENSPGVLNSMGSDFEQLGLVLSQLKPRNRFGICFDTCHAFATGYDLRTEKAGANTLEKFDKILGFEHLKILHLNDSKTELGSRIDRHEHVGLGQIGEDGLSYVMKIANSKEIPTILETPIDQRRDDMGNLKKARELAGLS